MSIHVTDFKWEKGKNDLKYIELLEKTLDITLDNLRKCSKVAREQYNKGYAKGKTDERAKVFEEIAEAFNEHLFDSPMMNPIMTRNEILLFLEQLKEQKE